MAKQGRKIDDEIDVDCSAFMARYETAPTMASRGAAESFVADDLEPLTPRLPFGGAIRKVRKWFRADDCGEYSRVSQPAKSGERLRESRKLDDIEKGLAAELAVQRRHDKARQASLEALAREEAKNATAWKQSVAEIIDDQPSVLMTYQQLILACSDFRVRRNVDSRERFQKTLLALVGLIGPEKAEILACEAGIANGLPFVIFADLMILCWPT